MVNTKKKVNITEQTKVDVQETDMPEDKVNWCSVSLSEVVKNSNRIEASTFSLEAKHAREILKSSKYQLKPLYGIDGFFKYANNSCRFKRDYKNKNTDSIGFLGSSEILNVYPKAEKYISLEQAKSKGLVARLNEILITCSGTIGNISLVSKSMINNALSQHMIRAYTEDLYGYIYAFLKTKIGKLLIQTNTYGSVVQHIEPKHLENIEIPNPPDILKKEIHNLIVKSYDLRDESNDLIDEAEKLLIQELKLPPIEDFKPKYYDLHTNVRNYEVSLSKLNNRFDGSYHVPIVDCIIEHLKQHSKCIKKIGDKDISSEIILPGRFARTYVEEGQGTLFFGGKQINELEPSVKKYLSLSLHSKRIESELKLKENMVLITRSGTIGRVNIVPHHWENWVINEHVIRINPISKDISGYIYCWLNSEYGKILIERYTYGSVVNEIDTNHVANIYIPIVQNKEIQLKINNLVLEANQKRYDAYKLEQKAIRMVNEKVISI